MGPRDHRTARTARGRFPRPNLTMRELIGLVLAFAVSNAFLSWITPGGSPDPVAFVLWNGMLAFYLGFAFAQAWIRSVIRWSADGRRGSARPRHATMDRARGGRSDRYRRDDALLHTLPVPLDQRDRHHHPGRDPADRHRSGGSWC